MVVAQAHTARGEEWEQYSNVLSVPIDAAQCSAAAWSCKCYRGVSQLKTSRLVAEEGLDS